MIKNFFKTAVRNIIRNKSFAAINVVGLAIGIAACILIFLIVFHEYSFDRFERDGNKLYRVVMDMKFSGNEGHSAAVPAPLAKAIQQEVTGVSQTIPLMQFQGDATIKVSVPKAGSSDPVVFKKQPEVIFTSPDYFSALSYQWLAGNAAALQKPFSVVLTESRAKEYFPSTTLDNIPGKEIVYDDTLRVTVSGIVKDLSQNTFFSYKEFISYATIFNTNLRHNFMMDVWDDWMAYSQLFIKLSNGTSVSQTEAQLAGLLKKYNKNKDDKNTMSFRLQPLSDVHFNENYQSFGKLIAHRASLFGLMAIAIFLLILGCINFINLTTAQASQRAKEIGIRKTMGSSRKQIVLQFLGETLFLTAIASVLSLILIPFLVQAFREYLPEGFHYSLISQPLIVVFVLALTVVVSFLAGFYPALVLSGYKPVLVLKSQVFVESHQTQRAWLRKVLTVFQFSIAQFFVIATVMVGKQIHYTLNKDLGFKKDAIISFDVPRDTIMNSRNALFNSLNDIPGVQMVSRGFLPPAVEGAAFTNILYVDGKNELKTDVQLRFGDANYLPLYNIKLLAGRNVTASDTIKEFVINESYARFLGFQHPADAINKQLLFNKKNVPIVGVMRDFNMQSLHAKIGPLVFGALDSRSFIFHIALKPQITGQRTWQTTIKEIEKQFKKVYPDKDFDYSFFDEKIAGFYKNEKNISGLLTWATGLSILISSLGLLGLIMFTTFARTKEIGIRKVLGATVVQIVGILSKDFVRLIVIAFLISIPAAWWAADKWLQDFAYRTNMSWWVFAISGLLMIVVALVTISFQSVKAAMANPVKSLRTE